MDLCGRARSNCLSQADEKIAEVSEIQYAKKQLILIITVGQMDVASKVNENEIMN
jgi:hypothetical protein